jgi:hypothetical protein
LYFRRPEPLLNVQIFRVLYAADAVGDHETADPLRMRHRII